MPQPPAVPICDYEGSRYRTEFWEGQGREFEDLAERIALKALLPPEGRRIAEVGAGFGRLADLYRGYEQVILVDYSRTMLAEARDRLQADDRFLFVAGNVYQLPLASGVLDALVMVRVAHHLADIPTALAELHRALADGGTMVMEYANKRHLKAILRYLARRQDWSPFDDAPYEFVPLNLDFHPRWMTQRLTETGFEVIKERAVSHWRLPLLKRLIQPSVLAQMDGWIQSPGAVLKLAPSVFVQAKKAGHRPERLPGPIFRCPTCGTEPLSPDETGVPCLSCRTRWPLRDGIYDFKESIPLDRA